MFDLAFRNLFGTAKLYIEGKSSIHELNGVVCECIELAIAQGVSESIIELLREWRRMIDRRWNEWGFAKDPLTEKEFILWLKEQLIIVEGHC